MYNPKEYEETFCPEGLDSRFPQNWRRRKYALDYLDPKLAPPYSDGDIVMSVYTPAIGDSDLDNYTLGVLTRLLLIDKFDRPWQEIYNYGNSDTITKAVNKLIDNRYIVYNKEQDKINIKIVM